MINSAPRHNLRTQLGTFHGKRAAKRASPSKTGARLSMPSTGPDDSRPIALSREPCPRCSTRGDLGCPHQQPFNPQAGAFS
tara:strand:- start:6722 stop:6964 length:243 start_codon:yes stop_codon:yes gene_type:complete